VKLACLQAPLAAVDPMLLLLLLPLLLMAADPATAAAAAAALLMVRLLPIALLQLAARLGTFKELKANNKGHESESINKS